MQQQGRREPSGEHAAMLAFDVGGTRIKAGVVRGADVTQLRVTPLPEHTSAAGLIEALVRLGDQIRAEQTMQAVGVSMKGIIDPQAGTVLDVNESWSDLVGKPFAPLLAQRLQLPTCVENDARMYTLGEMLYGAGRQVENLLCLTLGTGIGSGVALQRRVLRGPRGVTGILGGHITVQVDGPRCTCGNVGCLEACIGTASLLNKAAQIYRAAHRTFPESGAAITPQSIFAAALDGDTAACEVVDYFIHYLRAGIVSLIHAYDPDLVVLGGGIAGSAQQIMPAVQRYIDQHAWTLPRGRVRVVRAQLGDAAALVGVAALARGLDVLR